MMRRLVIWEIVLFMVEVMLECFLLIVLRIVVVRGVIVSERLRFIMIIVGSICY